MNDGPHLLDEIYFDNLFHHLNFSFLLKMNQICKGWKEQSLRAWQEILRVHFPYTQSTRPNDYQESPQALFFHEKKYYTHWWMRNEPHVSYQEDVILSVMSGNLRLFWLFEDSKLEEKMSTLAVASGHPYAVESQICEKALYIAAKRGNEAALRALLQNEALSREALPTAFYYAAKNGHLSLLPILIGAYGEEMAALLQRTTYHRTAMNACLTIAENLIKKLSYQPHDPATLSLEKNKHLQVMSYLAIEDREAIRYRETALKLLSVTQLNEVLPILLAIDDSQLLEYAAKQDFYFILRTRFEDKTHVMPTKDRAELLEIAAQRGHRDLIQLFFNHDKNLPDKNKLSGDQKGKALKMAAMNGYAKIYQDILDYDKTTPELKQIPGKTTRKITVRN